MENFNDLIQSVGVIDFKNQNVRENFWLDTQKFIQMEAVPMQRFNWADSAKSLFPQNTKKFKNVTNKLDNFFEMNDA